ncbi:aldo/keto reductase [Microbacterium pumilum]|uniref:Aldo/keto reductase n=1 Tax=Microbacterium pumilum TaxID=344165 RepID=A0ABN2S4Y9_9MICO
MKHVNWGILATGNIAHRFAETLATSETGTAVAVASREHAKATAFAEEFDIPTAHGSYDDLLADPNVEAVYVSTPHPQHAEWIIRAARAGKHILSEKPAALTFAQAEAAITAARENDVFFMEAFMYRCHPQTAQLVDIVRSGEIGDIRLIRAMFSFQTTRDPEGRLFANALGGGGILDVGSYCMSMARLLAGAAQGLPFAEPVSVKAVAQLDPAEGTDLYSTAVLEFDGGLLAELTTGVLLNQPNTVAVYGSEGSITVDQPWFPGAAGSRIVVSLDSGEHREIETETTANAYHFEVDTVARHLADRAAPSPAMSPEDTLGNMRALDSWRAEAGVVYGAERRDQFVHPLWAERLSVHHTAGMEYASLPGVERPLARLVMGGVPTTTVGGQIVLDDYFERGGNVIDTAFHYDGVDESIGHWLRTRGVREDVSLIVKGAHTPNCTPEALSEQLEISLERLGTDHGEIYIMHRDNLDVPVGEFIDVLNSHRVAGRIGIFGGSNWSIDRLSEANAYAAAHGLQGFSLLNNQLSLAAPVEPVWAGCLSANDPNSRQWLAENHFPFLAWSSQARGFFTARAAPDRRSDAELVRCWYSNANFERKRRAAELAAAKGCEEINIALAWVLYQPFPTWTLIGPATTGELHSSLGALKVSLTPEEVAWLNLESDR